MRSAKSQSSQINALSLPSLIAVCRGHDEAKTRILISGTRGGLTAKEIIDLRRRSAIEAEIGHMKTDGRLSRCPLKGTIGAQSSPS